MQYVYLNKYESGYMYVGSHKWSGEGIDPDYKGSSTVAACYGWSPISIEILEVVTEERKLVAEREWIEKYAQLYGIADCASVLAHNGVSYLISKYGKHGLMLNLHSNDGINANLSKELRRAAELGVSLEYYREHRCEFRKKQKSEYDRSRRRNTNTSISNRFSSSSVSKATRTRIQNGSQVLSQQLATEAARSPEARAKFHKSRRANARKCILNDGFVGCGSEIAEHTRMPVGSASAKVSEAYKFGMSVCNGWVFKPCD